MYSTSIDKTTNLSKTLPGLDNCGCVSRSRKSFSCTCSSMLASKFVKTPMRCRLQRLTHRHDVATPSGMALSRHQVLLEKPAGDQRMNN